jgi:signal transduction histidine kinase
VKPRRHPLRLQMAELYAGVFLAAGLAFIAVNFGIIERSDSGLIDAIIGIGIITLVALAAGWFIAGQALRPLRTVTVTAQQVSATTLNQRIDLDGPHDELWELADTIDALLARLEASFERERRFVANASHEIRTPLALTRTALEVGLAKPDPTVDELRDVIRQALGATARSETLANDLLLLARSENLTTEPRDQFDLGELAGEIAADLAGPARDAGVELRAELRPAPMTGITGLIDRLVVNLVENAIRHNTSPGWITMTTRAAGDDATITVRNTCQTATPGPTDQLFEPFHRGPAPLSGPPPAGHGLGLSIVRAIAQGHGAHLRAAYAGNPTVFEIELRFPTHGHDTQPA